MAIEIRNASMSYGQTQALREVSVSFESGKIYGLLGPNGAGKTTLLNVIANRRYPTAGEVLVDGERAADNDRALGKIFLMSDGDMFADGLTVKRGFGLAAALSPSFDHDEALRLAAAFDLPLKKKISSLSTGYASIFRLSLALAANTPYLLLDEPVLGLDAQNRDMFYRLLLEKCAEAPRTVIFSTHLIEEAAGLIEHAVILHRGRVIKDQPVEELLRGAYTVSGPAALVDAYAAGRDLLSAHCLGGLKTACLEGEPQSELPAGLELSRVGLQDYFINLMNKEGK